jgi:hypothetical protein
MEVTSGPSPATTPPVSANWDADNAVIIDTVTNGNGSNADKADSAAGSKESKKRIHETNNNTISGGR